MKEKKITVLGTGPVGQTISERLIGLGYEVTMGTRNVDETIKKPGNPNYGTISFIEWYDKNKKIELKTFTDAVKWGELVFNCLNGLSTIAAIKTTGESNFSGKILIDVANELDFSKGMPPYCLANDKESLGERIQLTLPEAKVVKTLNTTNANNMVYPQKLANGDHSVFMSGNDPLAKLSVSELLREFGWVDIIDVGDITAARGMEMLLPLWIRLWGKFQTPQFNFKIVKGDLSKI